MSRTITVLLLAACLPGCIFYARKDRDGFVEDDADDSWTDDADTDVDGPVRPDTDRPVDTDPVDTDGVDTDPDTDVAEGLTLDPDSAPADSSTIVSIQGSGDPDLRDVTSVQVFGTAEVEVIAVSLRSAAEVLVTLTVPDGATPGAQDVLLELDDGTAVWLPDAFTVTAP